MNRWILVILLISPVLIAYGMRMEGAGMPITDRWAESTVYNYYFNQAKAQVLQQYPNLPEKQLTSQANAQMKSIISNPSYKQNIAESSNYFKNAYRYDDEHFYMPDIDPYEYLKETHDIVDHGHIGDVKKDDGYWYNMHSLAPIGNKIYVQDLHPVVLAWIYKLGKFFKPSTTIMQTSMYVPIIFSALATIFVFLVVRRFAGEVGGFFGAVLYGIHPVVLSRTLWGHADTDVWQVLFIPMIIYFAIEILLTEGKKRYLFAGLAGLSVGLFASAWSQWYVTFDVMLGAIAIYVFIQILKTKSISAVKPYVLPLITFFAASGIFVSLIGVGGWQSFLDAPFVVFGNFGIKNAAWDTLWPNVYTTVAELAPISFNGIIGIVGKLWMLIAGAGFAIALLKKEWLFSLVAGLLFISATVSALVAGTRFTMFLALPVALLVGFSIGITHKYATEWMVKTICDII